MDLGIAGIGEISAFFIGFPGSGHVGSHGIGAQEEHVAVSTGAEQYRMAEMAFQLAGHEVAGYDAPRLSVYDHQVQHLMAGILLHISQSDLALQCLVGSQQQLLTGLSAGIESAAHLGTPERAVIQQSAIFSCKRHTLCHALVNDVDAHFRQAVHIGFAGTEVAAFHGIVEETIDRISVVLIVLGCVDASLGSDGVCPAGRILKAEGFDLVAQFRQRSSSGGSGQSCAHHDDLKLALVGRVDQFDLVLVVGPLIGQRPCRYLGVECHVRNYLIHSKYIATGMRAKSSGMRMAYTFPAHLISPRYFSVFHPKVWKADWKPCSRCHARLMTPIR